MTIECCRLNEVSTSNLVAIVVPNTGGVREYQVTEGEESRRMREFGDVESFSVDTGFVDRIASVKRPLRQRPSLRSFVSDQHNIDFEMNTFVRSYGLATTLDMDRTVGYLVKLKVPEVFVIPGENIFLRI
ncbi:hypothetical protein HDU82_008504 [Entophlyctis luteolus]|nr:hypothetical protein HDU82_008504 [Entophlyctis luteolus]